MAKLKDWEAHAKEAGGVVVAWINQAEAKNLAKINSEGVCNAITRDWIKNGRGYASDRAKFLAKLSVRNAQGQLEDANVPDEYIAAQKQLSDTVKAGKIGTATRQAEIEKLVKAGKLVEAKAAVDALWRYARLTLGGADCQELIRFKTLDETVKAISARTDDIFIGMALMFRNAGHIVGMELQPKRKWFQFLDANSGLFAFSKLSDMLAFVQNVVWPRFYKPLPTSLFVLYIYDIGAGGVGLSPDEQLAKDFEEIQKMINELPVVDVSDLSPTIDDIITKHDGTVS